MIVDGLGSSEAGGQLTHVSTGGCAADRHVPAAPPTASCCRPTADRVLEPGDRRARLAGQVRPARPRLPRRPRQDRRRPTRSSTASATPCPATGPGCAADGTVELHGRDASTINSGGEKIFAEEVEAAVKAHPDVYDCVVAGRPSERWGSEVVAVVQLRAEARPTTPAALRRGRPPPGWPATSCRRRSCSSTRWCGRRPGKADYRWAREVAARG